MVRYSLHEADQVVIAGYFFLLAAVGFYFWRRTRNVRDLFTGGNNIPGWLAGLSFYRTAFSAFTFAAYSEIAYRYGIVALTLTWSSVVSMIVGTIFLAGGWLVERKTAAKRARIESFFHRLDEPMNLAESVPVSGHFSSMPVIGWTTFGVGCLLMCSAAMLPAGSERTIDVTVGLFLCISGGEFYLLGREKAN